MFVAVLFIPVFRIIINNTNFIDLRLVIRTRYKKLTREMETCTVTVNPEYKLSTLAVKIMNQSS